VAGCGGDDETTAQAKPEPTASATPDERAQAKQQLRDLTATG
jgi:hypothetical protein